MAGQSDRWITTARLLRRVGFGTTGAQVDAVAKVEWPAYVDAVLNLSPEHDPGAIATPLPTPPTIPSPGKGASAASLQEHGRRVNGQLTELSHWWLRRMVAVRSPLQEKLTLLWHNHFATSAEKVRSPADLAAQNQKLRTHSLGDFRTLAYLMLTDVAMMLWLDAQTNTAKSPNENLAREFIELFTLGHGNGYTEHDVREGARALTGWTIRPATRQAVLVAKRHDHTPKTLFGVTKNFDAAGFCDVVLAQPKSPQYVAGQLWQQLASDTPPAPQTLDRLVKAYGQSRDLRALTRAILTDDEFVHSRAAIVNTPVEWLIGVLRTLRIPIDEAARLNALSYALAALGQRPFYPPDVGGWPHGRLWLSTASADLRMRVANRLALTGDVSTVDEAAAVDRIDAVGYLIGIGAWSNRTVTALKPLTGKPVELVAAAVNTPEYLTS
ncbi:DUF1800 domain-containing protein [Mycobacterium paraterrae]|uniref:DUF1800 domain-containing protein n=1 Tax=Mycobacterium paraterrae TaxID=577492 RepID=A0ABY3VI65_9MYCO|nr:DUF1800 domain-containing protein [Mycobacterium paraterrae]UMB69006.1 DUF1800 domain-containing protein [Mycobacterium paraterrae]